MAATSPSTERTRVSRRAALLTPFAALGVVYLTTLAWLAWWVVLAVAVPGWTPVTVTSGSMTPSIRVGDLVIADRAAGAEVGVGTVIVFEHAAAGTGLLTHRVVEVDAAGGLRTQGDANPVVDPWTVAPDDVVGRGRLLIPAAGLPRVWVEHGAWLPLLGAVAGGVVAAATTQAWWAAARATGRAPSEPPVQATPSRADA